MPWWGEMLVRMGMFFLGELMRRGTIPTGVDGGGNEIGIGVMGLAAMGDAFMRGQRRR